MRSDDDIDDSICGDVVLYKTKESFVFNGREGRREVDQKYLMETKTVKYKKFRNFLF